MSSERSPRSAQGKKTEPQANGHPNLSSHAKEQTAKDQDTTKQQTSAAPSPISALTEGLKLLGIWPGVKPQNTPPTSTLTEPKPISPSVSNKVDEGGNDKEYFLYYKGMKF